MADVIEKVLEPALTYDLMTIDEVKITLNITDASSDDQLNNLISYYSDYVAELANRVFAREKVQETWRELNGNRRLWLSHFPVKEEDIISVTANGVSLTTTDWTLEEKSGKLSIWGSKAEPIVVTYYGGFELPDGAPPALKNAAMLLLTKGQTEVRQASTAGIRSISHKDSRVMFFDPNAHTGGSGGIVGQEASRAAMMLLYHYTRFAV